MKVLSIIETAYRATLEEQDDTIIWLSHALKGAGADLDVLLQGNAVNYVVESQDASGLKIGNCPQTQPPRLPEDVKGLISKGCKIMVVSEDLQERGITSDAAINGIRFVHRTELAACLDQYQQVWHW